MKIDFPYKLHQKLRADANARGISIPRLVCLLLCDLYNVDHYKQ